MAKNIVNRVDRNLGRRLREARRELGLSTRGVVARLPSRLAVSHTTLASYENGVTAPPITVLAALADVYNRTLTWFLDNRESLSAFRYRNLGPRVRLGQQRQFEALTGKWADAYLQLERELKARANRPSSVSALDDIDRRLPPEQMAAFVRRSVLDIDDDQPIHSVVEVLESFSAWALELKAPFGVDGAAAQRGRDLVVVLNPQTAPERLRMNAAHEVAYVIYKDCPERFGWSEGVTERRAYWLATCLLMPESQLKAAFDGKSFIKLVTYKEKFGISLAAMIYRAEKSRIINTTTARHLWTQMAIKGWRAKEPGSVSRDRAIGFETMLDCAIQTKQLTWLDAERITGIREYELKDRIETVMQTDCNQSEGGESEPDTLSVDRWKMAKCENGSV